MKVTILTYVTEEGSKGYDAAVEQIARALRSKRHEVSIFGISRDVSKLVEGIKLRAPDIIFNLAEMFGDDVTADVSVAGLLNLLGYPYTGGGAGELYLAQDKVLGKKLLAYEHVLYPNFALFTRDADLETGGSLRMPLIVKPAAMDASIGIDGSALVRNSSEMMKRVAQIHEQVKDAALVEEYIEGREFYVGVLGNLTPVAFPPVEMDFSRMPDGMPHVLDQKAKFDEKSEEYKGTRAFVPALPEELSAKLQKVSIDAYRALRVRDYGRVDLRLTPANEIYVIEVNSNCYLEEEGEFVMGARASGLDYVDLIEKIGELAIERHRSHDA